jgi:hypothetical protein
MQRRTSHQIAMGQRADVFCQGHPITSSGAQAAVSTLDGLMVEAKTVEVQQRDGIIAERSGAAVRRKALERVFAVGLKHVQAAARRAESAQPGLSRSFQLTPTRNSLAARRAAADSMLDAAEANKEVLVKFGLDESMVTNARGTLAECDAANDRCNAGRALHVRASAQLRNIGRQIVDVVHVLDGLYQVRFEHDPGSLAEWRSASTVQSASPGESADESPADGGSGTGSGASPGSASGPSGDAARPAA